MTLYFENYHRVMEVGRNFSPGLERDKFMYGLVGVMAAHMEPEVLGKLLDKVAQDMGKGESNGTSTHARNAV